MLTTVTAAAAGTNRVTLTLSENVRCADFNGGDFEVRVDGEANSRTVTADPATCTGTADNVIDVTFDGGPTVAGNVVRVTSVPAQTPAQRGWEPDPGPHHRAGHRLNLNT